MQSPVPYIVRLTPDQMDDLAPARFSYLPDGTFKRSHEMPVLDLDALRLVLEAAIAHQESEDSDRLNPESRKGWEATRDAIAALEPLTR